MRRERLLCPSCCKGLLDEVSQSVSPGGIEMIARCDSQLGCGKTAVLIVANDAGRVWLTWRIMTEAELEVV